MTQPETTSPLGRLQVGDQVLVLTESPGGNPRTPTYLRGRLGTVVRRYGVVSNPLDHAQDYPPLYSLVFELDPTQEVLADLHEEWLTPLTPPGPTLPPTS